MSRLATDSQNRLRKFFSQGQVAEALGISKTTVRALIDRHQLTAVVVAGNCVRVPAEEIERYLQARRMGRAFHIPSSAGKPTKAQRDHLFAAPDHDEPPITETLTPQSQRPRRRKV